MNHWGKEWIVWWEVETKPPWYYAVLVFAGVPMSTTVWVALNFRYHRRRMYISTYIICSVFYELCPARWGKSRQEPNQVSGSSSCKKKSRSNDFILRSAHYYTSDQLGAVFVTQAFFPYTRQGTLTLHTPTSRSHLRRSWFFAHQVGRGPVLVHTCTYLWCVKTYWYSCLIFLMADNDHHDENRERAQIGSQP